VPILLPEDAASDGIGSAFVPDAWSGASIDLKRCG
jgi:hypothetical protein